MRIHARFLFLIATLVASTSALAGNNLHKVDSNSRTGYEFYRTGKPSRADYQELCKLGVTQMIVLSGDADAVEKTYQADCPKMEVIYNTQQVAKNPLSSSFLKQFDEWVRIAKEKGIKIAIRCDCGCHRTGRLAAYYNMKYRGMSADAAIDDMKKNGKYMFLYKFLNNQVRALDDYNHGRKCSESAKYCVDYSGGKKLRADEDPVDPELLMSTGS